MKVRKSPIKFKIISNFFKDSGGTANIKIDCTNGNG